MRKIYFILFLLIIASAGSAQDFHLSQYDAAPLHLNPSLTGAFNGKYRIAGNYRSQWSAIASNPFVTTAISYDQKIKKNGVGIQIMNQQAGLGNYKVFALLGSYSYDFSFDSNSKHHLAISVQGGILQKSVDFARLTFDEQYRNTDGGGFNQNAATGETAGATSITLPDVNAGLLYYFASESSKINPFLGASVFHINQPEETFFNTDNKLPIRFLAHTGGKINFSPRYQLLVGLMSMKQSNAQENLVSLISHVYLPNSDSYILFGPTYRNKDAAIFETGLKHKNVIYRLSYDVNTSTLQPATRSRGGFEISVTYIGKKPKPSPSAACPRL